MDRWHRRSIRIPGYDYTQPGAYFVTFCTHQRRCTLGEVRGGGVVLTEEGEIVRQAWQELPRHYANVRLDAFTVMPNHVHALILLEERRASSGGHDLPEIVRAFKPFSARRINEARGAPSERVWQRNYYEHIVRDEHDLLDIREYIANNPRGWPADPDNPDGVLR